MSAEPRTNFPRATKLHHEAMAAADDGDQALKRGDPAGALLAFQRAHRLELEAVALVHVEPSRGIMQNSADELAKQVGKIQRGELPGRAVEASKGPTLGDLVLQKLRGGT